MQLRVKVEVFGDKEKITTESTDTPIGEGIIVGELNVPKGTPVSIKMPSILDDVRAAILIDSMPDPRA